MSWKRLTPEDMRLVLAESEMEKLELFNKASELYDIVQKQLDLTAAKLRGAFIAKGYTMDVRDYYLPPAYWHCALVLARYTSWSRFPNSPDYALDEARQKEYEDAKELIKNPYLGVEPVDYSDVTPDDPDYPKIVELSATTGNLIRVPWLRVPPETWEYGFPSVYFGKYAGWGCCK